MTKVYLNLWGTRETKAMAQPFNQASANQLATELVVQIDRFFQNITNSGKVILLGFADIQLTHGLLSFKILGCSVKILNGNLRVDMPSSQATGRDGTPKIDQRTGKPAWIPHCFPKNAETRWVITGRVMQDARVQQAIQAAASAPVAQRQPQTAYAAPASATAAPQGYVPAAPAAQPAPVAAPVSAAPAALPNAVPGAPAPGGENLFRVL